MQITIDIPPELGEKIKKRLPEMLERAWREIETEDQIIGHDEQEIMYVLASRPTPAQILALRPSPEMQQRVSFLLAKNKSDYLTHMEERELDRYFMLEHLVRLAKGQAQNGLEAA